MFYFFHDITIVRLNKEKDDIQRAYVYFTFFTECKLSQLGYNHIAHVAFVLHCALKTHLFTNQNARTIK